MEKGPQYICSIRKRVHNISVQYGTGSTIYPFNMEKDPQYISSIWKKGSQYISSIRGPQNICSIRERVHNTSVNTESVYNISFNVEKGPQ